MMKKLSIFTLLAALTIGVWLPNGVQAQEWRRYERSRYYQTNDRWRERDERRERMRRMRARMYRNMYGYPSYATNRRYRLERQYFYRDGRRYVRTIRVYF